MKYIITLLITVVFTTICYASTANDTVYIQLGEFLPAKRYDVGVSIFINCIYTHIEPSYFEPMKREGWYDLSKDEKTNDFILTESNISVGKDYNDCLQDSITYVSSENNIMMIRGITQKNRKIKSIVPDKNSVRPGENMDFIFNNKKYILRGEGIITQDNKVYIIDGYQNDNTGEEIFNYKLYLSTSNKEQLLLSMPKFKSTFVEILLIGDLDRDGKPDFVFDVSRDYEERRVMLFLSSPAQKNEIVRIIDEAIYIFDC